MAGKAYTMREMRAIVEYLTERKAYAEIKGRKMWMEYANSEKTIRTWQSLKETFLKRILPDIQNPYYKLSMDQVRSFRQGFDVAETEKNNRLEFRTARKDSMGDSQNENEQSTTKKDNEPPATSHDSEKPTTSIDKELEKATGETITSAKISRSRSSADTVVLEYENAEEIQRALESPKNDRNEGESKSLKDLLTFEPMTPLVQELLDDFETESEPSDKEPQLNIVENPQEVAEIAESEPTVKENIPAENHITNKSFESPIEINDTADSDRTTMNDQNMEKAVATQKDIQDKSGEPQKNNSLKLKNSENNKKEDNNNTETNTHKPSEINSLLGNNVTDADPKDITEFVTAESNATTLQKSSNTDNKKDCSNIIANTGSSMQNSGSTLSDTILPNNQEALDDSKKANQNIHLDKTGADSEKIENNGKRSDERSSSQNNRESKKQKLSDKKLKETKEDETSIRVIVVNDTPTYNDSVSILEKNTKIPDTEIIEISTDTPTPNITEHFNARLKTVSETTVVSGTSTEKDVSIVPINQDKNIEIFEDKNPCLLSVSLFDEQFKNTKYSESDSDDEATPVLKQNKNKANPEADTNGKKKTEGKPQKDVDKNKETELKIVENIQKKDGTSVSGADCEQQKQGTVNKTDNIVNKAVNLQRERALANVFGFTQGFGASITRKRQLSHRRRSHRHHRRHSKNNDSNSSEWTSESDSESYVSPPRGRRSRQTKKYLKPKSSRILQDPEEGMLYVIFGKKIYPLVKDGKHIKNFLTYRPDSGSDEEESYWRQKYVEEKKRVEEVKKLLKESRENEAPVIDVPTSPTLPSKSRNSSTTHSQQRRHAHTNGNSKDIAPPKVENKSETGDNKLVLKIAAQNGLEYCLEGGWRQISNAMPEMVKMLQSETETKSPNTAKNKEPSRKRKAVEQKPSKLDDDMEVSSEASTPDTAILAIDPEVHEKVNKIEMEIFKEIEEREKEEQVKQNEAESINVTQRKPARPRKESSSSSITKSQSPAKKFRISKTSSTESKQETSKSTKTKRASKPKLDIPEEQLEHKQDEIEKPKIQTKTKIKEQLEHKQDEIEKPRIQTRTKIKEQLEHKQDEIEKPKIQTKTKIKEQLEHKQDEIEKPRIQTRTKIKEQQTKEKDQQSKTTTEQQTKATEQQTKAKKQQSKTTEEQTIPTEQQTKVSQHQTEQNASDPTVGTITLDRQQNQIINKKQPKRRESLRLSKQKKIDDHNSSKGSSEKLIGRSSTRLVKTPKKYDTDSSASDIILRSGKSTSKETAALLSIDDENTRFMIPPSPKSDKKSPRKIRSLPKTNLVPLQENTSSNSIDSTQGYQDTDASPINIILKKKKKISYATKNKYKNRRITRRNSYPTLLQELSSDSNNSSYFVPSRKSQSSINSEVYRTDSFQLLVPKEKRLFNKLKRIDENSPTQKFDTNIRHFNYISKDSDKSTNENSNTLADIGSSSIVSLPLSPELSVVENLSISKEMIRSESHPIINEVQSNVSCLAMDFSEYMISNVDVSVPLMDQQCELRSSTDKLTPKKNAAASYHQIFNNISDQVFNKVCTVRIENLTLSETLDQRLRDLLLESNKKTTRGDNIDENAMDIDQTEIATVKKMKTRGQKKSAMEGNESKTTATKKTGPHKRKENAMEVDESKNVTAKKTRAQKRSSTPRKKKTAEIQNVAKDRVIVEEHMESCSFAGRKSCPPVIIHLPVNENTNNCTDVTLNPVNLNTRKKKDVIKVKIQRPRENSRTREKLRKTCVENVSVMSNNTDSGINDTGTTSGLFLKENEDSVDLIHNHSETCLLANECMGDSVEFVENSVSIVSLSSSEQSVYSELQRLLDDAANLSGELFVNSRNNSSEQKTSEDIFESPETVYHAPVATNSSLLTEDLSDDPAQQIKWCFLSDDDTNAPPASSSNVGTFGSNLKHIFPITCAVPDLSTISEMSKENEDSRKPNFDTDCTGNFDLFL